MPDRLSARQRECLALSGTLHDEAIAERLGISVHTVRTHIREAKERLGVNDRKAARRRLAHSGGGENEVIPDTSPDAADEGASPIRVLPAERSDPRPTLFGVSLAALPETPLKRLIWVGLFFLLFALAAIVAISVVNAANDLATRSAPPGAA